MAADESRASLPTRSCSLVDQLAMLLIPIILLLASAPSARSQGPLPNVDNFFIVADSLLRNVYQVDSASGDTAQLLPFGESQPVAVAYDPTAKVIYWTDLADSTINRYSLVTKNSTVIYRDPKKIARYTNLAIDVERQKLYYADSSTDAGKVGELSTDGTGPPRVIYTDRYCKPGSLVLDADNRTLYWVDYGTNPAIYRSSVINPARVTVIADNLRQPTALAIDFTAGVMYWGDSIRNRIESAYLNGAGRKTLLQENFVISIVDGTTVVGSHHYYNFVLSGGYIYFTDHSSLYLRRLNIATRKTSTKHSSTPFQRLNGIVFVPDTSADGGTSTTTPGSSLEEDPAASSTTSDNVLSVITITVACGVVLIVIAVGVFVVVNKYVRSPTPESSSCLRRLRRLRHPRLSPDGSPQSQLSIICDDVPLYGETSFSNPIYDNDAYELETISSAAAISDCDPSDPSDPISDDVMDKYVYGVSSLTMVTS